MLASYMINIYRDYILILCTCAILGRLINKETQRTLHHFWGVDWPNGTLSVAWVTRPVSLLLGLGERWRGIREAGTSNRQEWPEQATAWRTLRVPRTLGESYTDARVTSSTHNVQRKCTRAVSRVHSSRLMTQSKRVAEWLRRWTRNNGFWGSDSRSAGDR